MNKEELNSLLKEHTKKEIVQMIIDGAFQFEDVINITIELQKDRFHKIQPDPTQLEPLKKLGLQEHHFVITLNYFPWKGDSVMFGLPIQNDYYSVRIKDKEYKVNAIPQDDAKIQLFLKLTK